MEKTKQVLAVISLAAFVVCFVWITHTGFGFMVDHWDKPVTMAQRFHAFWLPVLCLLISYAAMLSLRNKF